MIAIDIGIKSGGKKKRRKRTKLCYRTRLTTSRERSGHAAITPPQALPAGKPLNTEYRTLVHSGVSNKNDENTLLPMYWNPNIVSTLST